MTVSKFILVFLGSLGEVGDPDTGLNFIQTRVPLAEHSTAA